ncbi:hypothetical protein BX070DRAFT_256742 [Coemansia spiralis]|nr:hypothetical protein BX070DRAFT_256742 [Coemansia spiralis]
MSGENNGDGRQRIVDSPSIVGDTTTSEGNNGLLDGQYFVNLTPNASVAVLGLAAMRYGQEEERRSGPGQQHYMSPVQHQQSLASSSVLQLANNPAGRYLSSMDHYHSSSPLNPSSFSALTQQQALVNAQQQQQIAQAAAIGRSGAPIGTTATTPAIFVSVSDIQGKYQQIHLPAHTLDAIKEYGRCKIVLDWPISLPFGCACIHCTYYDKQAQEQEHIAIAVLPLLYITLGMCLRTAAYKARLAFHRVVVVEKRGQEASPDLLLQRGPTITHTLSNIYRMMFD